MTDRKVCGARTKAGGACQRPAGWGTPNAYAHAGRCKLHGGCSPTGRKAAQREVALTFAHGQLGASVDVSPVDAMEDSVRLAKGLVEYYRYEISAAAVRVDEAGSPDPDRERIELLRPQFAEAIRLERDCAKAALDAGVAERRTQLAERQAALLAAVFMDAIRAGFGDVTTPERQARAAEAIGRGLRALEQGDEPRRFPPHAP